MSGGGSARASSAETVKIPGLYDNVDFPDIWSQTFDSWAAPGPAVVSFADSSDNQNTPASSTSSTGSRPTQTGSTTSSSTDGDSGTSTTQCRLMDISSPSRLARRSLMTRLRSFPTDFFFVLHTFTQPST